MPALEWVDSENPGRIVTVFLDTLDGKISVFGPQKVLMRFVDLLFVPTHSNKSTKVSTSEMEIHVSSDKSENYAALKLPEYDLVSNAIFYLYHPVWFLISNNSTQFRYMYCRLFVEKRPQLKVLFKRNVWVVCIDLYLLVARRVTFKSNFLLTYL